LRPSCHILCWNSCRQVLAATVSPLYKRIELFQDGPKIDKREAPLKDYCGNPCLLYVGITVHSMPLLYVVIWLGFEQKNLLQHIQDDHAICKKKNILSEPSKKKHRTTCWTCE
jgi:hypothetical protein